MSHKYVLKVSGIGGKNKKKFMATQAVSDITTIANSMGYRNLTRYVTNIKGGSSIMDMLFLVKLLMLPNGTTILYQHPVAFSDKIFYLFVKVLRSKKFRLITLIHDLDMYRYQSGRAVSREKIILNYSTVIISHNEKMSAYLIDKGVDNSRIIELGIFDYLVADSVNKAIKEESISNRSLVIAGNLKGEKCKYLYTLIDENKVPLDVYGVNFEREKENKKQQMTKYHGAFPAPQLPSIISGGFGLVWDGESVHTCSGNYGEYLKINNPHKTSLYLVSGLPIVIWKQAALAEFVVNNGLGLAVDSLEEASTCVQNVTKGEYLKMIQNVNLMGEKLRAGKFTQYAVKSAEER